MSFVQAAYGHCSFYFESFRVDKTQTFSFVFSIIARVLQHTVASEIEEPEVRVLISKTTMIVQVVYNGIHRYLIKNKATIFEDMNI